MRYNLLEVLSGFFSDINKSNKKQIFMNGSGSLISLDNMDFYMLNDKKKRKFTVVYRHGKTFLQRLTSLFKYEADYCEIFWDEE